MSALGGRHVHLGCQCARATRRQQRSIPTCELSCLMCLALCSHVSMGALCGRHDNLGCQLAMQRYGHRFKYPSTSTSKILLKGRRWHPRELVVPARHHALDAGLNDAIVCLLLGSPIKLHVGNALRRVWRSCKIRPSSNTGVRKAGMWVSQSKQQYTLLPSLSAELHHPCDGHRNQSWVHCHRATEGAVHGGRARWLPPPLSR
jgi:hypothetical protein